MTGSDRFTDWLRARSEPDWTAVVTHPFADALFDGSIPDDTMRSYLVQDHQFIDDFLALLGSALAKADRPESRLRIAGSITVVTSDENTYFQRAFDVLGVGPTERERPSLDEATAGFRELMGDTTAHGDYSDVLALLAVAEWSYLEWAARAPHELPPNFVHAEWITLHHNPGFSEWVRWLRDELDRVGAELDERERAHCLRVFQRATRYELDFFDTHWPR